MSIAKKFLKSISHVLPDRIYLHVFYMYHMHKRLNLKDPRTFNEKLQWLKLYDRNPEYTKMVDKYEAKMYVAERIGEQYIIPTLGVWDSFEDIDFDSLPEQFVLKCTHDSGSVLICKDKSDFDFDSARKQLSRALKQNFFYNGREWSYKNVKPRIIAEQYMEEKQLKELRDYKIFTFNGKAEFSFIASDRFSETEEIKKDFFDRDFNHISVRNESMISNILPPKPINYDLMIQFAEKLSKDIPHVRVDFYEVDGRLYFGEMTFFHNSGFVPFEPEEWDLRFGEMLTLPNRK